MARPTNTTGYHPKGIYRTPLTTDGQHLVASSGSQIDLYGKFVGESGSSFTNAGSQTITGAVTIGSGGSLINSTNGALRVTGGVFTTNTDEIPNHGVQIIHSTENIKMKLQAPVTGSFVKLVVIPSTKVALDNCAITFIVTTAAGRKGRISGTSCRQITLSTNVAGKLFTKGVELVGTTKLWSKAVWLVANIYGPSSNASPADGLGRYTVSSSTA